jgi:hypothetical protein
MIVLSLYDYTGEAVKPWAKAGYECHCYDIQHDDTKVVFYEGGGSIHYKHGDLFETATFLELYNAYRDGSVVFGMAFPVCTDMAVSGARHFKAKAEVDPRFQVTAANRATRCATLFDLLAVPFFVENPVSVLATLWRKPNHSFHPYQYGGYIAEAEAQHPRWPEYIADRDAYPKKTCLWTGNGFNMPVHKAVAPVEGYSKQHLKLGGKSMKTKNIRSATPRGFAIAIYEANKMGVEQ